MTIDYVRDLALFVEVARARGFIRAAARLDMPPSSLSRRISDLEASLGLKLLRRSTRRVELTEAGALYLASGESLVEAAKEAHGKVRGLLETPSGTLRISVEPEVAPCLAAPLVARYLERFPHMRIELDRSRGRIDEFADAFDLAIRIADAPDSGLAIRWLGWLRSGLYASPAYIATRGAPAHPSELIGHARIQRCREGEGGSWRLSKGEDTIEIETSGHIRADGAALIRDLARVGVGIAPLDELTAREDVERGALRPILPDWTMAPLAIRVVTPSRILPAKTRIFIEWLAQAIQDVVAPPALGAASGTTAPA